MIFCTLEKIDYTRLLINFAYLKRRKCDNVSRFLFFARVIEYFLQTVSLCDAKRHTEIYRTKNQRFTKEQSAL